MDNPRSFQERLDLVRARMSAACARVGRAPAEVKLLAVTKTMPAERVREAVACGLTLFGENRVQEAQAKIPLCPGRLSWHLVGHLQRNKTAAAVELFDMIHSVDSVRLLETVDRCAAAAGKIMPVCLEVNVSGESSKYGMPPADVAAAVVAANHLNNVNVVGLMTIPPFSPEPEKARPFFRRLREIRDEVHRALQISLTELSMGMTGDFEVAIEEGATYIRVGTALFGERSRP